MKKNYLILLCFLISILLISGCGSIQKIEKSTAITIDDPLNNKPLLIKQLNESLNNVQTTKDMETITETLIDYFVTRLKPAKPDPGVKAMSTNDFTRNLKAKFDIKGIAKQEFAFRKMNKSLAAQNKLNQNGISTERLAAIINKSKPDLNYKFDDSIVKTARDEVRKNIPNIAPDKNNSKMSSLESSVVAWALLTGDDGSAAPYSITANKQTLKNDISVQEFETSKPDEMLIIIVMDTLIVSIATWINTGCGNKERGKDRKEKRKVKKYKFSFAALEKYFKDHASEFYFDNTNLPENTLAKMPDQAVYEGSPAAQTYFNNAKASSGGISDNAEWKDVPGLETFKTWIKGDLLFKRSNFPLLSNISSWIHIGMVYNTTEGLTFESINPTGVYIYNYTDKWNKALAFSRKQVLADTADRIATAVDQAYTNFNGRPYWPKDKLYTKNDILPFSYDWSDKDETSNLNCSKLVWQTFKYINIDLDSNRTRAHFVLNEQDTDDFGEYINNAWIGASPDDIYCSKHLGMDSNFFGLEYLDTPISGGGDYPDPGPILPATN